MVGEYIATLSRPGFHARGIEPGSSSIHALAIRPRCRPSALPKIAIFDNNHKLGFCTGANLEATLDTAEQTLDERRVRVKGLRPITDAATCYGAIGTRENMQDAVAYSDEQAVNGKGLCPANVSTRLARARLRIPGRRGMVVRERLRARLCAGGRR